MQTVVKVLKGLMWAFVIVIVIMIASDNEKGAAALTKRVGAGVVTVADRFANYVDRVTR